MRAPQKSSKRGNVHLLCRTELCVSASSSPTAKCNQPPSNRRHPRWWKIISQRILHCVRSHQEMAIMWWIMKQERACFIWVNEIRPNPDKIPAGGREVHSLGITVPLLLSNPVLATNNVHIWATLLNKRPNFSKCQQSWNDFCCSCSSYTYFLWNKVHWMLWFLLSGHDASPKII